jgi:hypothetical protein
MTFLRTGTDNEPFEFVTESNEPKRGYGEVLNFPNRNATTVKNNDNRYPNDNRLTDNVVNKNNALPSGTGKLKKAVCEYALCSNEFERTVSWKRFCCEICRIKAWESKHGKSFRKGRALK